MAEADPDSSDNMSELVDLKHIFSIHTFFGAKGTPDSNAGRSPTSPLDFGVFANFGGLFSPRSPAPSSPRFGYRNKWDCDKVGLSVLSSSDDNHSDSFRRENIVFAPQIKVNVSRTDNLSTDDPCVKSNSLPKNYSLSNVENTHSHDIWDTIVVEGHNSPRRSSSSPMDIISSQDYSRSLSAREMALSEDYTCIISHGPNPKTTHIFGDCILDCDPKELGEIEKVEDDTCSRVCICTRKPQDCQNIQIQSEASTEKETAEDSLDIWAGSSYKDDLFPMAIMALNTREASLENKTCSLLRC